MMLAQFQVRYPTGSLISELLTIYQGKFVVRVAVHIDGVIRATGIAAADTPELAEDQARIRAIALMAVEQIHPANSPETTSTPTVEDFLSQEAPSNTVKPEANKQQESFSLTPLEPISVPEPDYPAFTPPLTVTATKGKGKKSDTLAVKPAHTADEDDIFADFGKISEPQTPLSNVTPLVPRTYNTSDANTEAKQVSTPIDLSDVLAKTDVELERLRWTKEQGREFLVHTYGKRGRSLLTEPELLDFLQYLESQPNPS